MSHDYYACCINSKCMIRTVKAIFRQGDQYRRNGRLASRLTLSLLLSGFISAPVMAVDASLEVELSNVRALPFGFTVLCEELDLKFKSDSSATFVIRDSKLCSATAATLQPEQRQWFILCSNDPKRSDMAGHPASVKCVELEFKSQEV